MKSEIDIGYTHTTLAGQMSVAWGATVGGGVSAVGQG